MDNEQVEAVTGSDSLENTLKTKAIAVLDVGKTNKKILIFSKSLHIIKFPIIFLEISFDNLIL